MSNDLLRSGGIGQRPLYNLGGNFPIEPEALGSLLAQYLCQTEPELSIVRPEEVVAVMTPHIDHYRGAPVYASCARVLEAIPRPDLIVLMGTHHNEDAASLFHVDNRDMISPLGCAPCAIGAVEYLCSRFSHFPSFETTYAELDQEWSLEMTLPILQHRLSRFAASPEAISQ